jgi:DNA-binding GntR family transcriptional regulator
MNIQKDIPLTLQAYDNLKKKIMDLQLRPGEILMIQTLAKELGISRTPVREAIVRLEREGFVEATDGKKFKVSALTMKGVLEIHELRKLMELHAVKHVASTATKKQVSDLNKTIIRMQHALKKQSHDDFFEADLAFHEKIVFFHGNETLGQLMNQLNDKIQRIRYLTTYIDKRLEKTIGEHQDVVSAIEENNPEKAEQKLAFHLKKVKDGLAALFEKQSPQFLGGYFFKE